MDINKVKLQGTITNIVDGSGITTKEKPYKKAVFEIKTNVSMSGNQGLTSYVRCIAWNVLAEKIISTMTEGDRVFATGNISLTKYYNQKTNQYIERQNVTIYHIELENKEEESEPSLSDEEYQFSDDDLPY